MRTDYERQLRVERARFFARVELVIAAVAVVGTVFLFIAAPGFMFSFTPPWYETPLVLTGLAGVPFGFAAMIWIYRRDPEPGERTWRYHDYPGPVPRG